MSQAVVVVDLDIVSALTAVDLSLVFDLVNDCCVVSVSQVDHTSKIGLDDIVAGTGICRSPRGINRIYFQCHHGPNRYLLYLLSVVTIDHVVPRGTIDGIVAGFTVDFVIPCRTVDRIVTSSALDQRN